MRARELILSKPTIFIFLKEKVLLERGVELWPRVGTLFHYVFLIFLLALVFIGVYDLPASSEVDAEYLSGILTASSILFGFWFVFIERKPKEERKKLLYEFAVPFSLFLSLTFLAASVVSLYFSALRRIPSTIALVMCTIGFFFIFYTVALTLWFYVFKK